MATAYTDTSHITLELGAGRRIMLLDRDNDGIVDAGVEDDVIAKAGTLIDARLVKEYSVPFAAINANPATPDQIIMIATYLVCHLLYKRYEPAGDDQAYYWKLADGMLKDILAGTSTVVGATALPSSERIRSVTVSASDPVIAGVDPTSNDPNGTTSVRKSFGM